MTRAANTTGIEKATGITWSDWIGRLDALDANQLSHPDIASEVRQILEPLDLDINNWWWAQNITVAYEQHIGRRAPGQRNDGTYEVSVSKTFSDSPASVMKRWDKAIRDQSDFSGVSQAGETRLNETEKWLNWRVDLSDGTRLIAGIQKADDDKAQLGMSHIKLKSAKDKEIWRIYWKEFISSL